MLKNIINTINSVIQYLTEQKWHQNVFNNLVIFTSVILVLSLFGVSFINPKYEMIARYIIQIYISFFIILRFNPLVKLKNLSKSQRKFDRRVAFSAGLYIFTSSVIFIILHLFKRVI